MANVTKDELNLYGLMFGEPPNITLGELDVQIRLVTADELHRAAALGVVAGTGLEAALGPNQSWVHQISRAIFGPIAAELDSRGFEFPSERPHLDFWFLNWCSAVATSQANRESLPDGLAQLGNRVRSALSHSIEDPSNEIRPFLVLIQHLLGGAEFEIDKESTTVKSRLSILEKSHNLLPNGIERLGAPIGTGADDPKRRIVIFISYTRADDQFYDSLVKHLSPLERTGSIEIWSDRQLSGGAEFDQEIIKKISTADIVIPLLSASFVASDYCFRKELPIAIARHESGEGHFLPVIVRPFLWKAIDISKYQILPTRAKPVVEWVIEDNAWVSVVHEVDSLVRRLRTRD